MTLRTIRAFAFYLLTCLLLSAFLLSGCSDNRPSNTGGEQTGPAEPSGSPWQEQDAVKKGTPKTESNTLVVDIPGNATIVTMANINFDLERNEEQVLVVQDAGDTSAAMQIIVAAFDSVLETYRIVFQEEISAVNRRAFSLAFMDLVGDHNLEILCRGMDGEGRQTLDVFHRTTAPSGYGLFYKNIFSHALNGSIEIRELERSGAYQVGQANGVSFPILIETQDEESDNILDLVQRTYYWHFTEDEFIEGKVERIPGEEIEQQQLRELYRRDATAFAEFLAGSWYLTTDDVSETDHAVILNFDANLEFFTYFTGELQEPYRWVSTYKWLMNRVKINGDNELVPFIRKQFDVQVESLDTIRIRGTDPWKGVYARLSPRIERTLAAGSTDERGMPKLSGYYYSDAGNELFFEGLSFRLIEEGVLLQGKFALYEAGSPVLELRIMNRSGLIAESRRYRFDFYEELRDDRIFRTLILVPGIVGIYGFEPTEGSFTRYEQIETVEDQKQ